LTIKQRLKNGGFMLKALKESKWKYVNKDVVSIIKSDYENNTLKRKGMFLYGINGTGKTYLLHLIAEKLAEKYNHYPEYVRFTELLKMFFQNYDGKRYNNIKNANSLFIDEFGKGVDNNYYNSELEDLLEYRIMNYLPTYFASNYSIESLAKRGMKSVCDRLADSKTFRIIEYGNLSKRK